MAAFDDIEQAGLTDVGVRRSHNQDNLSVLLAKDHAQWQSRGHVFVVADGIGGHAVGELASALAVGNIPHIYGKYAGQEEAAAALRKAFFEANATIHARGQQNREFAGMGTTASALVFRPEGAWIGHVGDSRIYRVRAGQIDQLTFDHSMLWEYARQRQIDPDLVEDIRKNIIIRSLGPEPLVQTDIEGVHPLKEGDLFVLCSDGLSGQMTDGELGAVVSVLPPAEACRLLVDLANLRGGPDNITVIVVRVGRGLETPRQPGAPWHHRVPWPLAAMGAGVILATAAVFQMAANQPLLGILAFLGALTAIVGGAVGLWAFLDRERKLAAAELVRPRPKVHRSHSCRIDTALVERVGHSCDVLRQQLEAGPEAVDWEKFRRLRAESAELLKRGDEVGAFRQLCRALQVLLEAMRAGWRLRQEVFQPVYDRKNGSRGGNGKGPRPGL